LAKTPLIHSSCDNIADVYEARNIQSNIKQLADLARYNQRKPFPLARPSGTA
jgi:hypothetical protein